MYKLLVVDDEAIIRQGILCAIDWDRLNIKAFEANNGLVAYDMILKKKFDIVLLDIKMPGLNGLELIEKIKNSLIDLDVIFVILSGYADFSIANQAMKYGVKYYLLKPTDEEEIVSTIEKVIAEMKVKNTSHDKVALYFDTISAYIRDCNVEAVNKEMEALFLVLNECKLKESCINYCEELFILIIRQCRDYEQIPRFLRLSSAIRINTSLDEILKIILETILEIITINKMHNSQKYCKCIQLTLDYINENISNEELSLSYISNHLYMNSDYLGKLFKKEVKENFNVYLSNIRVKKAQELIQINPNNKICEIAEKVGFGYNSQYFSQVFKKHTEYTPKEYKAILMKNKLI